MAPRRARLAVSPTGSSTGSSQHSRRAEEAGSPRTLFGGPIHPIATETRPGPQEQDFTDTPPRPEREADLQSETSLEVSRHSEYFRPPDEVPEIDRNLTPAGRPIVGWEVFLHGGRPTQLYSPLVIVDEQRVPNSRNVWCTQCNKFVRYGGTVTHYTDHLQRDEEYLKRCRELSNPKGAASVFISYLFRRGDPFLGIETIRDALPEDHLPNDENLLVILKMMKEKVKEKIKESCAKAAFVNLALDGWSDPGRRRYEGIVIRTVQPDGSTAIYIATLKPVCPRYETAEVLSAYVGNVIRKFNLEDRPLTLCTDRGSNNVKAFTHEPRSRETFFERLWMPCACHVLNNFLGRFLKDADDVIGPLFRLASRFRLLGAFRHYLRNQQAQLTSIPTFTEVRWYSAHELFRALDILWPYMKDFAKQERMSVAQLTDEAHEQVQDVGRIFARFYEAQTQLEGDAFATGSTFHGHLSGIRHRISAFKEKYRITKSTFETSVREFARYWPTPWLVFALQALLNPSVRFDQQAPVDRVTYDGTIKLLTELVDVEIRRDEALQPPHDPLEEPGSDDFLTPRPSMTRSILPAAQQVTAYQALRDTSGHDLSIWQSPMAELAQLRTVARKVLSVLTTSSSAERVFSVGALLCGDRQLAMAADTVSARVMVQANWSIASDFLQPILQGGPRGWSAWLAAYNHRRSAYRPPPPELNGRELPHRLPQVVNFGDESDVEFPPPQFLGSSSDEDDESEGTAELASLTA